jgi:hypothetical protein
VEWSIRHLPSDRCEIGATAIKYAGSVYAKNRARYIVENADTRTASQLAPPPGAFGNAGAPQL